MSKDLIFTIFILQAGMQGFFSPLLSTSLWNMYCKLQLFGHCLQHFWLFTLHGSTSMQQSDILSVTSLILVFDHKPSDAVLLMH